MSIATMAPLGTAYAQDSTEVGFSVKAILPENQIDSNASYFDLRMSPKQEQALTVQINNEGEEEIEVKVEAISASTNQNGVIDYKTPDVRDESLKIPFSEIASVEEVTVKVAAGASEQAVIRITMPEEGYDGVILGGLAFTKQGESEEEDAAESQTSASGVTIKNVYSYVLGVKLTETDVVVSPDFEAMEAKPELKNYRVGVTHYIQNKAAAIAEDIDINVDIYDEKEGKIVKTAHAENIDMAPNSVMPYAVLWDGEIDPGSYISHVTMKIDGEEWVFEMPFKVTAAEATAINADSVETPETPEALPWWAIVLIILFAVLILLVVLLLIWHRKRTVVHTWYLS